MSSMEQLRQSLMKDPNFKTAYATYDLELESEKAATDVTIAIRMAYAKGFEAGKKAKDHE